MIKSNLRLIMAKRGIKNVSDVGDICKVSNPTITKLNNDRKLESLSLETILKVCAGLECTVEELLEVDYKKIVKLIEDSDK
ncbi:helix-turn-helix transcriptional regulator [Clostridium sp. D2Q-14]|uniref:helix-turn-helix domain-containing protein n=1 Tax=Anaeromonas gelatinilytica TaxID=2683194 RepID=UPI00193B505E|nr:helix-turn-helix transcriptional regulator [Anaeromonas gelatinilytica]MBS4536364.1 helix-turn-helix transcriptional regulator [Anaeromonas gelatinilytica]